MQKKMFFKITMPFFVFMIVFIAGMIFVGMREKSSESTMNLMDERIIAKSTVSPLSAAFVPAAMPPLGLTAQELAEWNAMLKMHLEPFSAEELSRMPGEPKVYEDAVNPPANLTVGEIAELNETIRMYNEPYSAEELSRMPGEPKSYSEAFNKPS